MSFLKNLVSFIFACLIFGGVVYLIVVGGAIFAAIGGALAVIAVVLIVIWLIAIWIMSMFDRSDDDDRPL